MKKKYYGCVCCRSLKSFGMDTTFQVELSNSTDIAYFETIARKMEKKYIGVTEERPLIRLQKKKGTENKEVVVLGDKHIELCNSNDELGTLLFISIEVVKQANVPLLTTVMKKESVKEALSDFNRLVFPGDFKYKGAKPVEENKKSNEEEIKMIKDSIETGEKRITDNIKEMTMELDRKIHLSKNTPEEYRNIPGVEESVVSAIVVDIDKMISELTDIKNNIINERLWEVLDIHTLPAEELTRLPKDTVGVILSKIDSSKRYIINKDTHYYVVSATNDTSPVGVLDLHTMYADIQGFSQLKIPVEKTTISSEDIKINTRLNIFGSVQQNTHPYQFTQPVNPTQAYDGVEGPMDDMNKLTPAIFDHKEWFIGDANITIDTTCRPYDIMFIHNMEMYKGYITGKVPVRRLYEKDSKRFVNAFVSPEGLMFVPKYPQGPQAFQVPPMFGGGFGSKKHFI